MIRVIAGALRYLSHSERRKFLSFLLLRSFAAFFDLLGILAIGFLATSIALFLSNGSDSSRLVKIAGLSLPAINLQSLPLVATLILVLFVAKALFSIHTTWRQAKFLAHIEARAAGDIVKNTLSNGLTHARTQKMENITFSVQHGSPRLFNSILNSVISASAEAFLFLLVIASFLVVDPVSAAMTIIYFAAVALGLHLLTGRLAAKASEENYKEIILADQSLGDLSSTLKESSALSRIDFFIQKIFNAREKASESSAKLYVLSGMPRYVVETALIVGVSAFVLFQTSKGDLISGASSIAVFLAGGLRLTASLMPLQTALITISQNVKSVVQTLDFLNIRNSVIPSEELQIASATVPRQPASVVLRNVKFKYPNSNELSIDSINLEIGRGQQIALIGPSGAGKSTIADLILGLLEPASGSIEINGVKPEQAAAADPGLFGYVPQQPGMVSGTIAENIALGIEPEKIDQLKLDAAIDKSHLRAVLDELELGSLTNLGNRKDELSGGQLQRIGLARAIYESPGLLIMDEATSALDAKSESEIGKVLEGLRGKVTVVLIAHRLNSVKGSDVVHYVERGRIEASGTLSELVASNEKVRKLAKNMSTK